MVTRILEEIARIPGWLVFLIGTALIGVIGVFDYNTGPEFRTSLFYVIPVALVAWSLNFRYVILFALINTATRVTIDTIQDGPGVNPLAPYWNSFTWFAMILLIALLIGHLRNSLARARTLALTDYLTGVANSRSFQHLAQQELERCRRYNRPFTIAFVDIDDFKTINDKFGHSYGNKVIQAVATSLSRSVRMVDLVSRQGGDEFMLLLHEADGPQAHALLTEIQRRCAVMLARRDLNVTLSIGGVTFDGAPESLDDAIRQADRTMYQVKNSGKAAILHRTVPVELPNPVSLRAPVEQ